MSAPAKGDCCPEPRNLLCSQKCHLLQRLGSKSALGDLTRSLCNLLSPSLVAPSHVAGLLKLARSQDEAAAPAAQDLLLLLAPADPGLVATSADQVHGECSVPPLSLCSLDL